MLEKKVVGEIDHRSNQMSWLAFRRPSNIFLDGIDLTTGMPKLDGIPHGIFSLLASTTDENQAPCQFMFPMLISYSCILVVLGPCSSMKLSNLWMSSYANRDLFFVFVCFELRTSIVIRWLFILVSIRQAAQIRNNITGVVADTVTTDGIQNPMSKAIEENWSMTKAHLKIFNNRWPFFYSTWFL